MVSFGLAKGEEMPSESAWTSPPGDLDATLLRLEDSLTLDPPYPLAIALPVKEKDRVYVIGHPEGGPLFFDAGQSGCGREGPEDSVLRADGARKFR